MQLIVSSGTSRFGTLVPQLSVKTTFDRRQYRLANALIYALASDVELASNTEDDFIVQTNLDGLSVYLELNDGSPREVERGKHVLTLVAQKPYFRRTFDTAATRAGKSLREVTIEP